MEANSKMLEKIHYINNDIKDAIIKYTNEKVKIDRLH